MMRIGSKITRACWMGFIVMTLASYARAQEPQWLDAYEFNQKTLPANSWTEIPGGFETREPGVMQFVSLPDQAIPSSADGRGIAITVKPKQVTFLYALNPVATNGHPILLRMTARASSPWASIALVALRGDLATGKDLDGSIGLNNPASAEGFVDKERRIVLVYEPDKGDNFTLALQVAGTGAQADDAATVWIDKVEMLNLDSHDFGADSSAVNQTITIPLTLHVDTKPLEMVFIPAGTFMMGSPNNEQDRWDDEGPQHQVTITKPFYMGKYEVTQAQWQALMGSNPSNWIGNNLPVEQVSWNDCQNFIKKLNQLGQGTFRLPTEAEWEYACRSGTITRFYWGDDPNYTQINDFAWYGVNNSSNGTKEVGLKKPNAFGLYDMSGNVWEWCQDWYWSYSDLLNVQNDPTGAYYGKYKILRGGYWYSVAWGCRSADRVDGNPDSRVNYVGFRVVLIRT